MIIIIIINVKVILNNYNNILIETLFGDVKERN